MIFVNAEAHSLRNSAYRLAALVDLPKRLGCTLIALYSRKCVLNSVLFYSILFYYDMENIIRYAQVTKSLYSLQEFTFVTRVCVLYFLYIDILSLFLYLIENLILAVLDGCLRSSMVN